jgi:hypothetical protein
MNWPTVISVLFAKAVHMIFAVFLPRQDLPGANLAAIPDSLNVLSHSFFFCFAASVCEARSKWPLLRFPVATMKKLLFPEAD